MSNPLPHELTITTTVVVDEQHVEDLLVTAVEHMGYGNLSFFDLESNQPLGSRGVTRRICDGERVGVMDRHGYYEVHGDEDCVGDFGVHDLLRGIQQHATQRRTTVMALLDDCDVYDADAIVQYAAFGGVVLG